jgi:ubiquinone/menaquinone biosynthesis C-methylase UbiE
MRLVAFMFVASVALADAKLDAMGQQMLDPLREQTLHPSELVARLKLRPDAVVADVGAGPGFLTLPLARAVPRGSVVATDIRADYLAVATQRATAAGVRNVTTRVVAPDHPGLDPRSIDLVLLCQVDHYLTDRVRYLGELLPALRPGGRVVLVNYQRYREADLAAARKLGLRVTDEWIPSPPFFAIVLRPQ